MRDRNGAGRYFVLAPDDLVAADAIAAGIVSIPWNEVKALRMAKNLDLGAVEGITLAGATLDDLRVADWARPEMKTEDYFVAVC